MTAPRRDEISWVLTPIVAPWMKSSHYLARATCPHGTTEHRIVGRPGLLMQTGAALTPAHALRTGCSCQTGELVIKTPDDETSTHDGGTAL